MTEAEWLTSADPARVLRWLAHPAGEYALMAAAKPDRKLRLFACGCCRLAWHLLTDERSRHAVEVAERYADGLATNREFHDAAADTLTGACMANAAEAAAYASQRCRRFYGQAPAAQAGLLRCLFGSPWRPATLPKVTERCPDCRKHPGLDAPITDAGRCKKCGGSCSVSSCPWLTPTVLALVRACYDRREGRACGRCKGTGKARFPDLEDEEPDCDCPDCGGTGRVGEGLLDQARLLVLSDALEEAGCANPDSAEKLESDIKTMHFIMSRCTSDGAYREYQRNLDDMHRRLEEARRPHPLLAHLRGPGPHVRGCWVLDLLLGKGKA